jgi:drug/metabolite transporter (DMT)-like permease
VAATSHRTPPQALGLLAAILSAATFATSGPFAKALLEAGWTSAAVVLFRVGGAALVLLPAVVITLRGRWHLARTNVRAVATYGLVAIAACQVSYFYAVQRLDVGVALLLEYLGVVLIVLWVWLRTRRSPGRLTLAGIVVSIAGLVLVLDLGGEVRPDLVGVLWGLVAALGLAVYFITAAEDSGLPPVALAGLGMGVGTASLGALGALGVVPLRVSGADIVLAGATMPWWVAIVELALVAAAAAYLLGIVAARRLGSTLSGFLGLTEVLFAVVWAALLLGEVPGVVQAVGGAIVLAGVVAVRAGELRAGLLPEAEVSAPVETIAVEAATTGPRTAAAGMPGVRPTAASVTGLAQGLAPGTPVHETRPSGIRLGAGTALEGLDG